MIIALGVGVMAFPYALEYILRGIADKGGMGTAYLLGATWKGLTGHAKEAQDLIEAHAKETAKKIKEQEAKEWHETNPDITTEPTDLEVTPGTSAAVAWINKMQLPPSSELLKKPGDNEALVVFRQSGKYYYYGVYTINDQKYYLVIPKGIEIYKPPIKYKVFHTPAPDHACSAKYNDGSWRDDPNCYEEKEYREQLWPTRWPGTTSI